MPDYLACSARRCDRARRAVRRPLPRTHAAGNLARSHPPLLGIVVRTAQTLHNKTPNRHAFFPSHRTSTRQAIRTRAAMTPEQREQFRQRLLALKRELGATEATARDAAKPVDLDQTDRKSAEQGKGV